MVLVLAPKLQIVVIVVCVRIGPVRQVTSLQYRTMREQYCILCVQYCLLQLKTGSRNDISKLHLVASTAQSTKQSIKMGLKRNVVYFYDPEVGNFHYGKPINNVDMANKVIVVYPQMKTQP